MSTVYICQSVDFFFFEISNFLFLSLKRRYNILEYMYYQYQAHNKS